MTSDASVWVHKVGALDHNGWHLLLDGASESLPSISASACGLELDRNDGIEVSETRPGGALSCPECHVAWVRVANPEGWIEEQRSVQRERQ
jgi:hypothetical protein